jgi:hypothetical protein
MQELASKFESRHFIDSDLDDRWTAVAFCPMERRPEFAGFRLA